MEPGASGRVRTVGTAFLSKRPWIVAPAMAVSIVSLLLSPAPRAQVAFVGGAMSGMLGWFVWEARRARRGDFDERYLLRSLLVTLLLVGLGCMATGAARSPLLPFLFAPTGVAFAAFGRSRAVASLFVAVACALLLLPGPFPPVAWPFLLPMAGAALLGAMALLGVGVTSLTNAHARAAGELDLAREAVIAGAEARSRALESLGAKVAHEIKNPLASVRGLVELCASESEGRTEKRLGVALAEVERIEGILRDYLSFARPLGDLEKRPVDLLALAEDVAAIVDGRAERAGVTVLVEGASRVVDADPSRLKEALLNLVGNALEATPRGGRVVLEVSGELRVRDTGRGMTDEELSRIGTPGFTTRERGTGLGVVLARAAIAQHGGSLAFESAVGRGTVAIMRLPG